MTARILVVDDEPDLEALVVQRFRRAIRDNELDFLFADDGARALELVGENRDLDLVITDINMPRMDGLTLVKSLRATPQYAATPILLLTTESSDAMKAQGKSAGATGWLVKPFDPARLMDVVKKVIG